MSKRMITYAVLVMMLISVFVFPATGYAETLESGVADTAETVADTASTETTETEKEITVNAPKNVKASVASRTSIRVSWNRVAGADGYNLYGYSATKGQYVLIKGSIEGTSYTQQDRTPGYAYRYQVKAYKVADGKRYYSKGSSHADAKIVIRVNTPKNVNARALNSSTIKVTWNKVSGADGYSLYGYSKSKGAYELIKGTIKGNSYVQKNRMASASYKYTVKAYKLAKGKRYYSNRSAADVVTTPANTATRRNEVVKTAKSRVGCSYRSGAEGPRSFDCSGLVYWTYKNADVKTKKRVSRSSSAGMYSALKSYRTGSTLASAKKGDILFFTRGGRISHTGVYVGDGKMVHASTPRTGVCTASVRTVHNSGTRLMAVVSVVK